MIDLIQIKSWFKKKNFKEDTDYTNELMQRRVHEYDYKYDESEKLDFKKESNIINSNYHTHLDESAIDRITEDKIEKWNLKTKDIMRYTSQYENDINLVVKSYVDKEVDKLDVNINDGYYITDSLVVSSVDGNSWLLTIDDNGVLATTPHIIEVI